MKYSINLRMKNPGVAKYLIKTEDTNDHMIAFYLASHMLDSSDKDHFVEIVDNDSDETIANFNEDR